MRRHGLPYLHPDGETLQLDLLGSEPMVRWQERKAAAVFLSAEAWSALPQTYARYGTETGRRLIGEVCRLEHAAGAVLTDGGMQACARRSTCCSSRAATRWRRAAYTTRARPTCSGWPRVRAAR